jgi:hypothetical protein
MEGCLEDEAAPKNFSIKKKIGQFGFKSGFKSGFESVFESGSETGSETGSGSETNFRPDPDPKQDQKLLFRIRNTALPTGYPTFTNIGTVPGTLFLFLFAIFLKYLYLQKC